MNHPLCSSSSFILQCGLEIAIQKPIADQIGLMVKLLTKKLVTVDDMRNTGNGRLPERSFNLSYTDVYRWQIATREGVQTDHAIDEVDDVT